ncbi:hypothetical protein HY632_05245 [Candidatus Uhrbacteria bacterium]|nr:hypothetical protein [Candidatus Uhrbacteria bacterium]
MIGEQSALAHNMSGASRSTVTITPRPRDERAWRDPPAPETVASGAAVRGRTAVRVSLKEACQANRIMMTRHPDTVCRGLRSLIAKHVPAEHDDADVLCAIAEETISAQRLVGCIIFQEQDAFMRENQNRTFRWGRIRDLRLAFAMLTKTSDRLFIASKTPNTAPELLLRELVTFDPRVVALAELLP